MEVNWLVQCVYHDQDGSTRSAHGNDHLILEKIRENDSWIWDFEGGGGGGGGEGPESGNESFKD